MTTLAVADTQLDRTWDLVVLGAGTAGLVASRIAASLGAKVLIIERSRPGGDCLWTGCVPSKTMIAAARTAAERRPGSPVDFGAVMQRVRRAVREIEPVDSREALERDGVTYLSGDAVFAGETSVMVGERLIRFRQAVIATGARPRTLQTKGAETLRALTSDDFWDLDVLPERLLIVGGGCMACELGQAMARLGSRVTIVQRRDHILPKESERARSIIGEALTADDVDVRLSTSVESVDSTDGKAGVAHLSDGTTVEFDRVLLALGRMPNTESLGLENAGVETDHLGRVVVDDCTRTSNPRIWAAGDVTPLPQFTATAGVNGSIAGSNAVLGIRRRINRDTIPRVTFTQPEVATIGVQAGDCPGTANRITTIEHADLDRAIAEDATSGFTQIITSRSGRILGASIVGPRAGETLGEVSLAIANGLKASQVTNAMHSYPTYNDGVWNACVEITRADLGGGAKKAGLLALVWLQRFRTRRVDSVSTGG